MKRLVTAVLATTLAMPVLAEQIGQFTTQQIGDIKLHTYQANDALHDMSFIIESDNKLVVIEPQAFKANIKELFEYTEKLNKPIDKVIASFHALGVDAYPEHTDTVISKDLDVFFTQGPGKGMIAHFSNVFKDKLNASMVQFNETLDSGATYLVDGVSYELSPAAVSSMPGLDIEINDKVLFQHFAPMQGMHLSNFFITNRANIDEALAEAKEAQAQGIQYFIGSHTPTISTVKDLEFEIAYLTKMQQLLKTEKTAQGFEKAMLKAYPNLIAASELTKVSQALYK